MKLNLGCGDDVRDGYVNVDLRKTHKSVVIADLSKFPWPFEDGSADEILMLDFLEHFPYSQTQLILLECRRVLKDDGTVVIQVPDAEHLTRALSMHDEYLCNRCGNRMFGIETGEYVEHCGRCEQSVYEISDAAMRRLYGGQDYPGNFHYTCFTKDTLCRRASSSGLHLSAWEEGPHQFANWNFKGRFVKGDLW